MLAMKPMKLTELFRTVNTFAQTGGTNAQCEALVREIENLTDMVGWAQGPIDPKGEWLDRLARLQDDIQQRYQLSNQTILIVLNDTLTRLGQAIAKHDEDVNDKQTNEDDSEDYE